MRIIGISGKKESGKNYIAELITDELKFHDINVIQLSAAEMLKDIGSQIIRCSPTFFNNHTLKESLLTDSSRYTDIVPTVSDVTYREYLINIARILRNIDIDIFINRVIDKISAIQDDNSVVIITDIRYNNEVKKLKEEYSNNLTLVRVNRRDVLQTDDISETQLDDYNEFDYIFCNDYKKLTGLDIVPLTNEIKL